MTNHPSEYYDPTIIVWDIETVRTQNDEIYERAKSELKKKFEAKYERQSTVAKYFNRELDKLALNPFYNQIISIAYMGLNDSEPSLIFNPDDEKSVVEEFISVLNNWYNEMMEISHCGYNLTGFDLPVLRLKAAKYRLNYGSNIFPRSKFEVKDLYWELGGIGSLSEVINALDLPHKYNDFDGSNVAELFKDKKFNDIKNYALQDVVVEAELAKLLYN
jgi:predicted PolB exonuclease-like 3'-5' exonuclease